MADPARPSPMGDEAAEAALSFLLDSAGAAGIAKAQMIYMERHRKIVLARLKRAAPADCRSDAARDDWARATKDYEDACVAEYAATEAYETLYWKRIHAEATLESWRTKSANNRGAGRMQ